MADGIAGIKQAAAALAAKRSGNWTQDVELRIPKGETVRVRFLDSAQEIDRQWAYVHKMPPRGKAKWGENVPCLDQIGDGSTPCPACEREVPRTVEGYLNLIWYDGPIYATKKDDNGNDRIDFKAPPVGKGDVLAIWKRGIKTLEDIDALEARWRGINSRDAEISRNTLEGFDVRYSIGPALDAEGNSTASPLTPELQELAKSKPDLSLRVKPPSYQEMEAMLLGGTVGPTAANGGEAQSADDLASAFNRIETSSPFPER